MLLLETFVLATVCSYGSSQVHLTQPQLSITREGNKAIRIDCHASLSADFGKAPLHWYRQRPGAAPEHILFISTRSVLNRDSDKGKFNAEKKIGQSTCTLTINKITSSDIATYYCASPLSSGYYFKVFGSGTKLIVTDIPAKLDSTKIQALPPSTEQDGKVSYMCLIQDFYPNVIKVTWEDEKKNAEKNAVHEEIWSPGNNQQSYSLSSWLTVDKNSNKNYRCKYQHEIKEDYVPMESPADTFSDTTVIPQTTTSCTKFAENNTTLSTDIMDSYIHRTAYFIYIVLLLKSTMYYVIVLFFICRMQSPIKHQGKKP